MTGLEFLSATIGQLIWPAFIIVVVLLLKDPIKQLASNPRLKRVKATATGLEIELRDELDQLQKDLDTAPAPPELAITSGPATEVATDFLGEMSRLAEVNPRSVVMESYVRLESALRGAIAQHPSSSNLDGPRIPFTSMRTLTRVGLKEGILRQPEASALDELTYLRNRVAHEPDEQITKESALRYAETAAEITLAIQARG